MKKSIYITTAGELKREQNTLCHVSDEGKHYIPYTNTREIYVFGEVALKKSALALCGRNGISLNLFGYYGDYLGSFCPSSAPDSGVVLLNQVRCYLDQDKRLNLASAFVRGSILNMMSVVRYYQRKGRKVDRSSFMLHKMLTELGGQSDVPSLMALEGKAKYYYFQSFKEIIIQEGFEFVKRTRRPPKDSLNALISFMNCLCYSTVLSSIYVSHLDPRISFLHETNQRAHSLNLDIADVLKPILVDRLIFSLLNKNIIRLSHFRQKGEGIFLNERGLRLVLGQWNDKIQSVMPERQNGTDKPMTYLELIRREVVKLEKHITQGVQYDPFTVKW